MLIFKDAAHVTETLARHEKGLHPNFESVDLVARAFGYTEMVERLGLWAANPFFVGYFFDWYMCGSVGCRPGHEKPSPEEAWLYFIGSEHFDSAIYTAKQREADEINRALS